MLSKSSIQNIKFKVPSIVQRARMGDQNALALITEIKNNSIFNEKAKYSFNVIVDYINKNPIQKFSPKKETLKQLINNDKEYFYLKINNIFKNLSPMACAILFIPYIGYLNPKLIYRYEIIFPYIKLISQFRNGNFHLIEMELN